MIENHQLRDMLVASYEMFRSRLSRRLGSDAHARDALHDVYVKLDGCNAIVASRPPAYLFRMALNAAADHARKRQREIATSALDSCLADLPDPTADPLRALAGKADIALLECAIGELAPRQRRILLEARVNGRKLAEIAQELGISQRMVEIELKHAVTHCAEKLGRPVIQRFGPRARPTSTP